MAKSKELDPIGRVPNLHGPYACVDFLGSTPDLLDTKPLLVMDGDTPTPSLHPRKQNPGKVRYYGSDV